jgi:transcriptional regulator with XRE-family HTH domain
MSRKVSEFPQRRSSKRHDRVNSGRVLFVARRAARLTQRELGAMVGIDHSFISLIEDGKRDIHAVGYETVIRIARALHVSPEDLFPVVDHEEKSA